MENVNCLMAVDILFFGTILFIPGRAALRRRGKFVCYNQQIVSPDSPEPIFAAEEQ
jgi:hypothetical protein